jgi:hypothetical protein
LENQSIIDEILKALADENNFKIKARINLEEIKAKRYEFLKSLK